MNTQTQAIESRVLTYWTQRAHDFGIVRENELYNGMSARWLSELEGRFPNKKDLKILDVGTGTGYFAILLSKAGYAVTGIDLTPAMIDEAKALAEKLNLSAGFRVMNAQELEFQSESFDVIVSRNLTWTLPDPYKAYGEWFRVLRPGGVLLNYDADYAEQIRDDDSQNMSVSCDSPYGHVGMTETLAEENASITMSMSISRVARPDWDLGALGDIGFVNCRADKTVGSRVLGSLDLAVAPMFGIYALKG